MAKIGIYLYKKKYANGKQPLMIRINHFKKSYTKKIAEIHDTQWNEKKKRVRSNCSDHVKINNIISRYLTNGNEYLSAGGDPAYFFASEKRSLLELLQSKKNTYLKQSKFRTAQKVTTLIRRIEDFGNIDIADITIAWIKDFDAMLLHRYNNQENTRKKYLKIIRQIISEQFTAGLIPTDPFYKFSMPSKKTYKVKLTIAELKDIENYTGTPSQELARDVFLFAVYNRGIRVADVLQLTPKNIINNRLVYVADKTKKEHSILLSEKSKSILSKYKSGVFLFPVLKHQYKDRFTMLKHIDSRNSYLRKMLNQISGNLKFEKKLSMHTARHTFAFIVSQSGVPVHTIKELLNHSSLDTTQRYLDQLNQDERLDNATKDLF